ncbi:MAG: LamB/YcsF family protein [Campylobacterota bacterium]|nr:LamB/YcsF family protein [Campylobacterota bacterium]
MLINCDIGERGVAHEIDDALMADIDIANIACSGHAGDAESIAYYLDLAQQFQVKATAHLSYKDRANFGRKVMPISTKQLLHDLDAQYALISSLKSVKLHGALYNHANITQALAITLASWLRKSGITEVLTQHNSSFDIACQDQGIHVFHEAFLDRRYIFQDNQLKLAPRSQDNAVIHDVNLAKQQYDDFKKGYVNIDNKSYPLKADTLCIHSDSPSALSILKAIKGV